jgi:hypothetical protein
LPSLDFTQFDENINFLCDIGLSDQWLNVVAITIGELICPNSLPSETGQTLCIPLVSERISSFSYFRSFWIRSFIPHPQGIKNYNLVNFTANGMQPTKYFGYLRNTVTSNINNENIKGSFGRIGMQSQTNTICPTSNP